jgi:hypothetical protein
MPIRANVDLSMLVNQFAKRSLGSALSKHFSSSRKAIMTLVVDVLAFFEHSVEPSQ